jgi:lactate dehydrogenase-like 2-hydroxyacid dehydrogenase
MRRGTRLVNVGRGSVVDEEAVARSLRAEHLGGYAADVFEMEDWERDDRPRSVSPAAAAHFAEIAVCRYSGNLTLLRCSQRLWVRLVPGNGI